MLWSWICFSPLFILHHSDNGLYDWISSTCFEQTCSVAVSLCRCLPWGSVVTIDTWWFCPAVHFIGFSSMVTLSSVSPLSPVGISTSPSSLSHAASLSFLLRDAAWLLSSYENGCSLVVLCHWTRARKLGLNIRYKRMYLMIHMSNLQNTTEIPLVASYLRHQVHVQDFWVDVRK